MKILDWCGVIVDVAESESATLVKVKSFKGVWNHHPTEWLEYRDGAIEPATPEQVAIDAERFLRHLQRQVDAIRHLRQEHAHPATQGEDGATEEG